MKNEAIFNLLRNRLATYRAERALMTMSDRELRDLGLAADDIAAVLNGSYQTDTTRRARTAPAPIKNERPAVMPSIKHAA